MIAIIVTVVIFLGLCASVVGLERGGFVDAIFDFSSFAALLAMLAVCGVLFVSGVAVVAAVDEEFFSNGPKSTIPENCAEVVIGHEKRTRTTMAGKTPIITHYEVPIKEVVCATPLSERQP